MAAPAEAVYCTLLTTDHYLPGAVVLAHSLRDNGTRAKIIALFTPETLKESSIRELQSVYDEIIPVQLISNGTPANLLLMDRLDLISTFTKIELWRQTQYSKIVYMDADVVSLRAPDELLSLEDDFAAAPDIGWPDIFNSGVMVLRPNMQDYYALRALAERGTSFDGGDQGLLNTHFKKWHRLSFTYNCTPSGNYQYMPAYRHFESTISLIHFIGPQKPWTQSRHAFAGGTPYYQLLGRWWATYDRHYRSPLASLPRQAETLPFHSGSNDYAAVSRGSQSVQISHGGAFPAQVTPAIHPFEAQYNAPTSFQESVNEQITGDLHVLQRSPVSEGFGGTAPVSGPELVHPRPVHHSSVTQGLRNPQYAQAESAAEVRSVVPLYVHGEEQSSVYVAVPSGGYQDYSELKAQYITQKAFESYDPGPAHVTVAAQPEKAPSPPPPQQAQQQQQHHHHHPQSQPEERPFSPPRAEWDASREPPPRHSNPEAKDLETQTYTMSEDTHLFQPPSSYPEAPKNMYYEVPATKPEPQKLAQIFPWESRATRPTRVFAEDIAETGSAPVGSPDNNRQFSPPSQMPTFEPTTPKLPSESWDSYSRGNAWDEVPEINKYIEAIQQRSKRDDKGRNNKSAGASRSSMHLKITDFPTEIDRPSLPVTPAPRRRSFWEGQEEHQESSEYPTAEGVPNQGDWNPLDRLEELRQRQLELFRMSLPQAQAESSDEADQPSRAID